MPLNDAFFATWTPRAQALLRIVTAYLFLTHGTSKLLGIPGPILCQHLLPHISVK